VIAPLQEPALPRSVLGSLLRAQETLARIRANGHPSIGGEVARDLDALVEHVREASLDGPIHDALTHVIDTSADICVAVEHAYFDPGDQAALLA